jgi:hypothetical protein
MQEGTSGNSDRGQSCHLSGLWCGRIVAAGPWEFEDRIQVNKKCFEHVVHQY